jgi:hypothetical protein
METEETRGLAVSPPVSPAIEAMPTSRKESEGFDILLPASSVIDSTPTSPSETEGPSTPPPALPVIEPMSSSQLTLGVLEESGHQIEKPDAQPLCEPYRQQFHHPVMREALKALIDNTISVVEYGNQVLHRYGYAEVLIVSDEIFLFIALVESFH